MPAESLLEGAYYSLEPSNTAGYYFVTPTFSIEIALAQGRSSRPLLCDCVSSSASEQRSSRVSRTKPFAKPGEQRDDARRYEHRLAVLMPRGFPWD
jgi:hypothetical protein